MQRAKGAPADPGGALCLAGVEITLDEAKDLFPGLLIPAHPLANSSNMSSVWSCPAASGVALGFTTGIVVHLGINDIADPAARWQTMAIQEPISRIEQVRGNPALLIPPAPERDGPGGLQFVEGAIHIGMSGNGIIPVNDLVAVAESLRAP